MVELTQLGNEALTRFVTSVACAALTLAAVPAHAVGNNDGRKGTTVVPVYDSVADIESAASAAEGVAARSIVISDLGDLTVPTPFSGFAPQPLAFGTPVGGIEPVIIVSETNSLRRPHPRRAARVAGVAAMCPFPLFRNLQPG